jgi:hypothetical protein
MTTKDLNQNESHIFLYLIVLSNQLHLLWLSMKKSALKVDLFYFKGEWKFMNFISILTENGSL